jgi:FlaA1/EpsC-like NDP-sugar epimerase
MSHLRKYLTKITSHWVILLIEQLMIAASLTAVIFFFNVLTRQQSSQTDLLYYFIANLAISLVGTWSFQTHAGIIRYTEINDITTVLKYVTFSFLSWTGLTFIFGKQLFDFPLPLFLLFAHAVFSAFLLIVFRILIREFYYRTLKTAQHQSNVIVYGAGDMGLATKKAFELDSKSNKRIAFFIDDNPDKIGKTIGAHKIEAANALNISTLVTEKNITEIILATNNLIDPKKKLAIAEICTNHGIRLTQIPPINEWMEGIFKLEQLKNVTIEMLLERPVIKVFNQKTAEELNDKVVLITGAAGSIGSEICRQLTQYPIREMVVVDQAETPLFELTNELRSNFPNIKLTAILASIRDEQRMMSIMQEFHPFAVFHAAAYKHVPLLEEFPTEVVKTNVEGTCNVVKAAIKCGAHKFVMVSSDKAVNPTNLMGASKRIAEMIVQHYGSKSNMHAITTRFGNVLGSNGSVVPIFRKQIEAGGPITVTHPEITRYFMTIPEASTLVIEAGTMGEDEEIFVFDMGEPIKIVDLAKRMINLSGQVAGKDIDIQFTGLRPGEKLFEELFSKNEQLVATHHPKILKALRNDLCGEFEEHLQQLVQEAAAGNDKAIKQLIKKMVPELEREEKNKLYVVSA